MKKHVKRIIGIMMVAILATGASITTFAAEPSRQYVRENEISTMSAVDVEFSGTIGLSTNPVSSFDVTSAGQVTVALVMKKISGDDTEYTVCLNRNGGYYTSFSTENLRVNAKKVYLPVGNYTVQLIAQSSSNVNYAYSGMIYNYQ